MSGFNYVTKDTLEQMKVDLQQLTGPQLQELLQKQKKKVI
jgi:hypothetical protein